MSKPPTAYVLPCGCRKFFNGYLSACDKHVIANRERAERDFYTFLIVAILTFAVAIIAMSGCALDTAGLGGNYVSDVDGSVDVSVQAHDSGVQESKPADAGLEISTDVQAAVDAVEADGAGDTTNGLDAQSPVMDANSQSGMCPKLDPSMGCAVGPLDFGTVGVLACCVPVDWEGYRAHCPDPFQGCRWKFATYDGWVGECCA